MAATQPPRRVLPVWPAPPTDRLERMPAGPYYLRIRPIAHSARTISAAGVPCNIPVTLWAGNDAEADASAHYLRMAPHVAGLLRDLAHLQGHDVAPRIWRLRAEARAILGLPALDPVPPGQADPRD